MSLMIFILVALMILSHSYGQDTSPHHSTWEDWKHWIHHWTGHDMPKELPKEMPHIPKDVKEVKAKGKGEGKVSIKEGPGDSQHRITLKVPDTDLKRPLKIDIPEKKSEHKVESKHHSKSPTRRSLKSKNTISPATEPVEKPDIVVPKRSKANPTLEPTQTAKTGVTGKGKEDSGLKKGEDSGLKKGGKTSRRSLKTRGTDGGKSDGGKSDGGKSDGLKKGGEVYSRRSLKAEFIPPLDMYSFPFPFPPKKGKGKQYSGWN